MKKTHSLMTIGITIVLITLLGIMPLTSSAAQVWGDDFDDGNYNGWIITGVNSSIPITPTEIDGNFTAEDKVLRALGPEWNHAYHESDVANGTWRFDIHAVDSPQRHFYVIFMSVDANITEGAPDGYTLMIATSPYVNEFTGYALLRYGGGIVDGPPLGEYETAAGVTGWHHIDITRDLSGEFKIYVNGHLRITATDTTYNGSDYFRFHTPAGSAIDNVTVYDSIEDPFPTTAEPTTTPTEPAQPIPLEWIVIGIGVPLVIIVIVVIMKKR